MSKSKDYIKSSRKRAITEALREYPCSRKRDNHVIHIEGLKSEPLFSEQPSPEQISNKLITGTFSPSQVITKELSLSDTQDIAHYATTVGIDSDVETSWNWLKNLGRNFKRYEPKNPRVDMRTVSPNQGHYFRIADNREFFCLRFCWYQSHPFSRLNCFWH